MNVQNMAYKFEPKHNMCAFLQVMEENQPLEFMINWLSRSILRFTLTEDPIIYRNHHNHLWGSAQYADDVNGQLTEAMVLCREI